MNRKLKRRIIMILTLLLLMSSIPSFAASPRFKDVPKGHWSYPYVEDMAKLGYLNGYLDGTFKPDGNLTFMESMSTLSRFIEPSEGEQSNALNKYGLLLDELKIKQAWEREGISIALARGVISENELRNANKMNLLRRPIQRQLISVFLAKSMDLEEKVRSTGIVALPFKDAEMIDSDKGKYIYVLLEGKVLSKEGKGGGIFEPRATLTRAEMATLLSKAYDYLQKNPVIEKPEVEKPELEKPDPVEIKTIKAKVKRITDNGGMKVLVIDDRFGEEEGYIYVSDTSILIDGKKSNISSLLKGQDVEIKVRSNSKDLISVEAKSLEEEARGIIGYIDSYNFKISLEYEDGKKTGTRDYAIDKDAKIYLDGRSANLKDLEKGSLVEIKTRNSVVHEIEASSKIKKIQGKITDIELVRDKNNLDYIITIEDKNEVYHEFYTDSLTKIYRKRKSANERDLRVRDNAYIEGEYNLEEKLYLANEIDADVEIEEVRGEVKKVTYSSNHNILITIQNQDSKKEETYELTRDAYIYVDKKIVSSLPVHPPYYAELVLEGDEIIEIYADSTRLEVGIVGTIKNIDYSRGIIELVDYNVDGSMNYGMEMTIFVDKDVKLADEDFKKLELRDLRRRDRISIVATREGINYLANTIQLR